MDQPVDTATDMVRPTGVRGEVPRIYSTCQVCRGPIHAQTDILRSHYSGSWLHLRDEDWKDNPHDGIPTETGAHNLAEAMGIG